MGLGEVVAPAHLTVRWKQKGQKYEIAEKGKAVENKANKRKGGI